MCIRTCEQQVQGHQRRVPHHPKAMSTAAEIKGGLRGLPTGTNPSSPIHTYSGKGPISIRPGNMIEYVSRKNVCSILIETQGKVRINLLCIRFHRPMSMCPGIMFEYMSRKNVCGIVFCCGGDFGRPLVIRFHLQ